MIGWAMKYLTRIDEFMIITAQALRSIQHCTVTEYVPMGMPTLSDGKTPVDPTGWPCK